MRTSTKVFLALFFITLVGVVLTSSFFFSSISITDQGLNIDLNQMTIVSIVIGALNGVFGTILYSRFLKNQKFSALLFFSVVPLTADFFISQSITSVSMSAKDIPPFALPYVTDEPKKK